MNPVYFRIDYAIFTENGTSYGETKMTTDFEAVKACAKEIIENNEIGHVHIKKYDPNVAEIWNRESIIYSKDAWSGVISLIGEL